MTADDDSAFRLKLLALGEAAEIKPLLQEALTLIASVTTASRAYLEVWSKRDGPPRFWDSRRLSDEDIEVSRGIIREMVATGTTVVTSSALTDPRFRDRGSVQQQEIEAVLCAPVGSPPVGALYLQGFAAGGGFDDGARRAAELFCRVLAPLASMLLPEREQPGDATAGVREHFRCPDIVGRSRELARLLEQAALVAPLDTSVLITGPPGTGKSMLARAIAQNSPRKKGPFVELNCAALPETLLESELFGVVKGAHSTATQKMPGKIAAAEGGTLFLDEVGELPFGSQAKLLQFLQSREYFPLGASRPTRADVRIITATNASLPTLVEARQFREDFYYRLNVMPLELPSLAARREDIPPLVKALVKSVCALLGFSARAVSPAAMHACTEQSWPGNIRQLRNVIEAGVIRANGAGSEVVAVEHLFPRAGLANRLPTFKEATRNYQRRFLVDCLERNDWHISNVARDLGISRSHVYNLLKTFELVPPSEDDSQRANEQR